MNVRSSGLIQQKDIQSQTTEDLQIAHNKFRTVEDSSLQVGWLQEIDTFFLGKGILPQAHNEVMKKNQF